MINVRGITEVGLDVFGGNNLDMQPTDLPQGLSPDNSDVAFLPGSVFTRPSLSRLISDGTTSQCVYATTFLKPDGTVSQLTFNADGKMYADGVQFGQTKAGNRFHCRNAFNRMFIAVSDGLHGTDVPLQYTPEGWLDRVSQDGPGAPPSLSNYTLPSVALISGSSGTPVAISTAVPIDLEPIQTGSGNDDPGRGGYTPPTFENYYTQIEFTTSADHGLTAGQTITIAGNSLYSLGTVNVLTVGNTDSFTVGYLTQSGTTGTGGTVTPQTPLLSRINNKVTATSATENSLRTGYKVTIDGVPDATQTITSIVIDNDKANGEATITVSSPHGFVPGSTIYLSGIQNSSVGGGITAYSVTDTGPDAGVATVTTATDHNLVTGDTAFIQFGTGAITARVIGTIISPTQFNFELPNVSTTGTSGNIYLAWPGEDGQSFTVASVPDATSFVIDIIGPTGTWNTGTISFPWNGTFYVTSITSATTFTYSQTGPNASIQSGSGTVTPNGQIEPGTHTCVLIFLTRTGYLTIPSPPVTITASGGGYLLVSNIPVGPSNVVARWLAFTGANGGNYFVLPVPPRDPSGQYPIGTSTVVPDNSTTSAIFDFDDTALFSGMGIDIAGNNLFNQQVLGPVLAFFSYGSRLFSWGERNKSQFFRNMGFEGGVLSTATNIPLGWTVTGTDGVLTAGDYGLGWQATTATISQSAYQNQNGTAILDPNTQYTYRAWVNGTSIATLSSVSGGFSAIAQISGTGSFAEAKFSAKTPLSVPNDLILTVSQTGTTLVDELEVIYSDNPYILSGKGSYINNPEAVDGVTGPIGPANDPHPVLGMEERKDVMCLLTSGPDGSLYETEQTISGEPATWEVRHKSSKCGLTSVWGTAKFEDWFCWTSDTGLRIFDGSNVDKMSQEIQPWWNGINPLAKQITVLANDPYTRRVYIAAAQGTATVSNSTYVLDYRDLNTSSQLSNAGTLHVGYTGKVITTDLTRKWSPWSMTMNFMGLLTLSNGSSQMAFCGGTGSSLSDAWYSTVYSLNEGVITGIDEDYGPFWQNSRYPTYFMISEEEAAQMQVGKHRLQHSFMSMNATGVGAIYVVPHLDRYGNTGRQTRAVAVTEDLARDLEFGLNLAAERICYSIQCQPSGIQPFSPTVPAGFRISSMTVGVTTHPYSPIRGKNF